MSDTNNQNSNKIKGPGFGKTVCVPFISGVLGATLVFGSIQGIPFLRDKFGRVEYVEPPKQEIFINNDEQISLQNASDTGVTVAQKVLPSVVGIKITYSVSSKYYNQTAKAEAEGSGVIISSDGYILTNNHVIATDTSTSQYLITEATALNVYLYNDETPYEAKVIGTDEQSDLAVIKIDKKDLVAATLGNSDDLQVGEWCMAIGNPLGMTSSVTTGVISALNRELKDTDGKTYNLIQTDTAINSGNSGGALVNSKGEVIGINTLKASGTGVEGLGFAIPVNTTKSIYSDLITYNKVKRPYIGLYGSDVTEDIVKANPTAKLVVGIYIRKLEDYSPAEKAGLRVGDVVVAIDEQKVSTMDELNKYKNEHQIGDTIKLTLNREGEERTVELTLGEQP